MVYGSVDMSCTVDDARNVWTLRGPRSIHLAAARGNDDVLRLLSDHGTDWAITDMEGYPALTWAPMFNRYSAITILGPGPRIPVFKMRRDSLALGAIRSHKTRLVDDIYGFDGWHWNNIEIGNLINAAVWVGTASLVARLLDMGAAESVRRRRTLLQLAVKRGHTDVARVLINKGADVNGMSKFGWSALMIAAEKGNKHFI